MQGCQSQFMVGRSPVEFSYIYYLVPVTLFTTFSDCSSLVKAIAWLKTIVREFKGIQPRTNEMTSLEERKAAENFIIKLVQDDAFAKYIQCNKLQKENALNKCSKLHRLNPILDEEGLLRVEGMLSR